MKIWDKNQAKRTFFFKEIRSSVKDTLSLFKYLENKLKNEEISTSKISEKEFSFFTKIHGKRIIVEVTDTDRENFLEINAYNPRNSYLGGVYSWSNKQIFGLKYSLWIVMLIVAVSIVPLIILLAIQENITQESQAVLRIGGIVLVAIGGGILILYLLSTRLFLGRQVKLYDSITEYSQRIVRIIEEYKEDAILKKFCWSCYKEIKVETQKCPHCGIEL
ncbi:MAG: zinc ribbon domain-containing protein [Candidatus Heimdallarchaeota archaeon]|nr:zinc ribbon domain-containing protein [Candidatus Heimdallarchaeota archaeon]